MMDSRRVPLVRSGTEVPPVKKLALALMAMSALVFGFGMVAEAQVGPYGGGSATITFAPANPGPGQTITITITGCTPGETLTLKLNGVTIATLVCVPASTALGGSVTGLLMPQQTGTGQATTTITTPTEPGTYTYTVSGSQGYVASATLVIAAPIAPPGGLPATGSGGASHTTLIALGLLVVGLGLFVVAQARRRRTPSVA